MDGRIKNLNSPSGKGEMSTEEERQRIKEYRKKMAEFMAGKIDDLEAEWENLSAKDKFQQFANLIRFVMPRYKDVEDGKENSRNPAVGDPWEELKKDILKQ